MYVNKLIKVLSVWYKNIKVSSNEKQRKNTIWSWFNIATNKQTTIQKTSIDIVNKFGFLWYRRTGENWNEIKGTYMIYYMVYSI